MIVGTVAAKDLHETVAMTVLDCTHSTNLATATFHPRGDCS